MRPNVWIIMEEQRPEPVILSQGANSNRNIAMGTASHLCGSLLVLVVNIFAWIAPLIFYASNNSEDPILKHHLAQSLNASLTFTIMLIPHAIIFIFSLGICFFTGPIHWICYLIWSINANNALKAGQTYNYPFTINFVSR